MLFEGRRKSMYVSLPTLVLLELAVASEPSASKATAPTAITRRRRRDMANTLSGRSADFKGWKLRKGDTLEFPPLHLAENHIERLDRRCAGLRAAGSSGSPVVQIDNGSRA